jgi:hypothetical protein
MAEIWIIFPVRCDLSEYPIGFYHLKTLSTPMLELYPISALLAVVTLFAMPERGE